MTRQHNTLESFGGVNRKVPCAEEAEKERARVQQLLRSSRVQMNKRSSMRSGSFPVQFKIVCSSLTITTAATRHQH